MPYTFSTLTFIRRSRNPLVMTQAEYIISKFGGINAMAAKLGHRNSSTVQGWYERGIIPPRRYPEILRAGKDLNTPVMPEDFVHHLVEEEKRPVPQGELPLQAAE
jgi:hypothetical protein